MRDPSGDTEGVSRAGNFAAARSRNPTQLARPVPGLRFGVCVSKRELETWLPLPPALQEGKSGFRRSAGLPCDFTPNGAVFVLVNTATLLPGQGGGQWSFRTGLVGAGCIFGTRRRTERTEKAWCVTSEQIKPDLWARGGGVSESGGEASCLSVSFWKLSPCPPPPLFYRFSCFALLSVYVPCVKNTPAPPKFLTGSSLLLVYGFLMGFFSEHLLCACLQGNG